MTLQEQLEKTENELKKVEEKRKDVQTKRKKILAAIEEENDRIRAENNQKIVDIIVQNFGEITEENIEQFRRMMEEKKAVQVPHPVDETGGHYGEP